MGWQPDKNQRPVCRDRQKRYNGAPSLKFIRRCRSERPVMSETSSRLQSAGMSAPPEFDLFVVHAEGDRAWVDGYLKPMLGLEPARVFTPRDFRLGQSVGAEFERGVRSSRYTLLVLSPAFLADRWAEFGEGLVTFSSVDEGRNRLLALTLHPCQAPLRLRFRESLDCTDKTRWDDESARLRRHLDSPEPVIEAVPCPYPGMVPFRKEDARFFHGRDAEIQNLLTLVRQHHFLAVIGSSGSGKSSLITAGLLPRLDDARNFPRGTWRGPELPPRRDPAGGTGPDPRWPARRPRCGDRPIPQRRSPRAAAAPDRRPVRRAVQPGQ